MNETPPPQGQSSTVSTGTTTCLNTVVKGEDSPEFRTKVQWYQVEKHCPKCPNGFMRGTGNGITTWGTDWENKCDTCHHKQWYDQSFPYTYYETYGRMRELMT